MPSRTIAFLLLAAASASAAAQKTTGAPLIRIPEQKVDLPPITLPKPAQPCANWATASVLEALLAVQKANLTQEYWVLKLDAGVLCREEPASFEKLKNAVDGEYILNDGSKVRVELRYSQGAPTSLGDLIAGIKLGRASLLFWKGRAYLLAGVTYDEYIYPNGQRMFEIRELRLRDPLMPSEKEPVTFVKGRDDPEAIQGLAEVVVTPVKPMPWLRP